MSDHELDQQQYVEELDEQQAYQQHLENQIAELQAHVDELEFKLTSYTIVKRMIKAEKQVAELSTGSLKGMVDVLHDDKRKLQAQVDRVKALHVYEGGDMMRGMSGDWVSVDDLKAALKGEK